MRIEEPEIKRPVGCCCDNNEWRDPFDLPPVCGKFEGANHDMNCERCEHDYECHQKTSK
jgi:hypothetical protein